MIRRHPLDTIAILALAVGTYLICIRNGFVFDDHTTVVANRAVTGPFSIAAAFTHDWFGSPNPRTGGGVGLLRPLVTLSFSADWHLGGGRPWLFHLTNILLHAFASALFFRVFAVRLGHRGAALFAGAMFAVHALHTESVASIVGRADIMAFIALVALWEIHRRPEPWALFAAPALFGAALLCKESALLVGPLLLVRDLRDREASSAQSAKRFIPLIAMVAFVAALRLHVFGNLRGFDIDARHNPLVGAPFVSREITAMSLFGHAVELFIAPLELLPDYGVGVVAPLRRPDAQAVLGVAALFAIAAGLVRWWRSGGARHDALLWFGAYGVFLVNAVIVHPSAFAERLWYIPSAGAMLLAGEAMRWWAVRTRARTACVIGAFIVAASIVITVRRNLDWRSDDALFSDAVAADRRSALSLSNLGGVRYRQGRYREAEGLFIEAARVAPDFAVPHVYLGMIFALERRDAEAEAQFLAMSRSAVEQPVLWVNYAIFLASRDRPREALAWLATLRARGLWTPEAERVERELLDPATGRGPLRASDRPIQ